MNLKTLSRNESDNAMRDWLKNYPQLPKIDIEYEKMRIDMEQMYRKSKRKLEDKSRESYLLDVYFGIHIYDYLNTIDGFNMRIASDDGFWRFLSLKVIPNIVAERWGKDNESHYWSKPARIWLRAIWWYIHLSWQGDLSSTESILESSCFSTDSILNLEERTGREGTYIKVYRYIMYFYSRVTSEALEKFKQSKKNSKDDMFRAIMRLNTARVMVIEPSLFLGGEKEYVRSLFTDLGVKV